MPNFPAPDTYAGIAARGQSIREGRTLVPSPPPELPELRLPTAAEGKTHAFIPRPPGTAESLHAELRAMRKKVAPFLRDLTPELLATRDSVAIVEAEWRLEPAEEWEPVRVPFYGGPKGRARAWLRATVWLSEELASADSLWLCFGGVDYKAAVFFNGEFAGSHEGFFAPFEFEVGASVRVGANQLLVRVDNDAACMLDGDKLYAATGLGWDEPGVGWHHCPGGMGVHRPVRIEARPAVHVRDVFVRPIPHENAVEVWTEFFNVRGKAANVTLRVCIVSQNFASNAVSHESDSLLAEPGVTRHRVRIELPDARLWSLDEPWLYQAQVTLDLDRQRDSFRRTFGIRTFELIETETPDELKGRFLLNAQPIRLRGANTMGHEQQCVLRGDLDQLLDDLLLAKLANLNFLRFTQRPVETDVYDVCDRIGLLAQSDLPLFGHLRRNQFAEAIRQAGEMERLLRGHPSCVLTTFINEPYPTAWGDKSHRHLNRDELEQFFVSATFATWLENPDRQIKPIDGDYEPPGPGLPDSHCYAAWYNGHGQDLGELHAGYWMDTKPGWNYACGEFGAEGLDPEALMRRRYPAAWLPIDDSEETAWTPARIHLAQTGTHYHLWFEPATRIAEWIRRSQAHQEWATRLMTEAFRRDNRMVSFAIHLFIDAWPAGWMKTIMDCERQPKPAYFAYREALAPLAVNVRIDRTAYFSGESVECRIWICADGAREQGNHSIHHQLEIGGTVVQSGKAPATIRAGQAWYQGKLELILPRVDSRCDAILRCGLLDANGSVVHDREVLLDIFPHETAPPRFTGRALGGAKAEHLASELGLRGGSELLVVSDAEAFHVQAAELHRAVAEGATALLVEFPPGELSIADGTLRFEEAGMCPRHFVARDPGHPIAQAFRENDFRFWFDSAVSRPAPLLHTLFFADSSWRPILRTGQGGWGMDWTQAFAAAEKSFGLGRFVVCQITLAGRLDNPAARSFLHRLLRSPDGSDTENHPFIKEGGVTSV